MKANFHILLKSGGLFSYSLINLHLPPLLQNLTWSKPTLTLKYGFRYRNILISNILPGFCKVNH